MKTWLVLDCPYLCYRAFYATPELGYQGLSTGVLFGFLKSVQILQDQFCTSNLIFAFDHGVPKRKLVYPNYKSNRRQSALLAEENQKRAEIKRQIELLKKEYLFELGYSNVFYQDGYEADDIIAYWSKRLSPKQAVIIVSTDKDLYQLLDKETIMWNPQKKEAYGEEKFKAEWKVSPSDWIRVKALAGCNTDNIAGIPSVGERGVCSWINGTLTRINKRKLIEANLHYEKQNQPLVELPYEGTGPFTLGKDDSNNDKWRKLLLRLGMEKFAAGLGVHTKERMLF